MTLQPFRSFTAIDRGTRVPATFAGLASFSYAFWVRLAAPLVAGRILRIGDPADPASVAVDIRVVGATPEDVFTQTNYFVLTRRHRTTSSATLYRAASPNSSAPTGVWLHLIASFPSGGHAQLYINGSAVAMTAPDAPLTGAPLITSTDELAIGDPTPLERPGLVGDTSRVTLFPFATSATLAMITYRHQSDPLGWIGIGSKDALAATNHSPVAVPLQTTATAGVPKTIDPRPVAFDQDGDAVSIFPGATASPGSVVLSAGALVYTAPASFVGRGQIAYYLLDIGGRNSLGRVDVAVTAGTSVAPGRPKNAILEVPSTGNLTATPSNLQAVYDGASAGNHIICASGTYTQDYTFSRTFPNNQPVVIRSATPHAAVFSGRIFNQGGNGHWFYEIKTTYQGGAAQTDCAMVLGNWSLVTRCWLQSGKAILVGAFTGTSPNGTYTTRHHTWIGWNRFNGQDNGSEAAQIMYHKHNNRSGTTPDPMEFSDCYCYRNFTSDTGPRPVTGDNNFFIYIGNTKVFNGIYPGMPQDFDEPCFANFIIEENYESPNSNRKRFIYPKNGFTGAYRNHRPKSGDTPFAQRHGYGTQWWGNRTGGGTWAMGGGGTSSLFTDCRRNVGGTMELHRGSESSSGTAEHQAADYYLMFANNTTLELGFKASPVDMESQGGKTDHVRIYNHLGTIVAFDPANVDVASIVVNAGNPLSLANPPVVSGVTDANGTVLSTFGALNTGLEIANQD